MSIPNQPLKYLKTTSQTSKIIFQKYKLPQRQVWGVCLSLAEPQATPLVSRQAHAPRPLPQLLMLLTTF